ncbi:hypothetical protein HPB50_013701 [Hyalomma asiaticum]|uniref:Uncharacterized protein n=1 Tax=Hyalomma asiaticum TaxID=266040 RepID=A0ACB7T7N9_HYAAI|nr:hypothetical protein HPB50_013701 [Hyalomma asiaticum]
MFTLQVVSCASDIFTATEHMQESMATERITLEDGHFYVLLQERNLATASRHYEVFRASKSLSSGLSALGRFLFLGRANDFSSYFSLKTQRGYVTSSPDAVFLPSSREWWPTDVDITGAAAGICKLQHLYDIPVTKMAAMKSSLLPAVSPEDFAYVARGCSKTGEFGNTSSWSRAAISQAMSSYTSTSFRRLQLGLGWLQANDQRWPRFRRWAKSKFKTAGKVYPSSPELDVNEYKKVSWLWDMHSKLLQRLTRRIAVATGLSMESAEAYQVANYGIGGHYTPHMDAHEFRKVADHVDIADGNRLATMLMYLSNVAAGGATAFVNLGVAVQPRVGDALFWYDVEPYNGSEFPKEMSFWHQKRKADVLTTHVGCPVLWGSKWIVTKWIHERNNVVVHYNTPG